jgi:hypothetical protein
VAARGAVPPASPKGGSASAATRAPPLNADLRALQDAKAAAAAAPKPLAGGVAAAQTKQIQQERKRQPVNPVGNAVNPVDPSQRQQAGGRSNAAAAAAGRAISAAQSVLCIRAEPAEALAGVECCFLIQTRDGSGNAVRAGPRPFVLQLFDRSPIPQHLARTRACVRECTAMRVCAQ